MKLFSTIGAAEAGLMRLFLKTTVVVLLLRTFNSFETSAEEAPLGTFFSVAPSPDGQWLAIGAGGAPGAKEVNGYIMKTPMAK